MGQGTPAVALCQACQGLGCRVLLPIMPGGWKPVLPTRREGCRLHGSMRSIAPTRRLVCAEPLDGAELCPSSSIC